MLKAVVNSPIRSGDQTINNGNLIIGTATKGIDFSANSNLPGMTSELLNWYEEGTWTPTQGAGLTVVGAFSSNGTYTRIGRQVSIVAQLIGATSIAAAASSILCGSIPYLPPAARAGVAVNDYVNGQSAVYVANTGDIYTVGAIGGGATSIIISATYFI